MSFNFDSNINPMRTQSAYKDGGGMGGGGMYMRQGKKEHHNEEEEDIFQRKEEEDPNEIIFDKDPDLENIPQENLLNKFVNWFRQGKNDR